MSRAGVMRLQAELMEVAERLAETYPELPPTAVAQAVADCADEFPAGDPLFVEQAARARLEDSSACRCDSLDVSSHEAEQRAEVQLTMDLIIAANDSPGSLSQEKVDGLLGLGSSRRKADRAGVSHIGKTPEHQAPEPHGDRDAPH